MLKEEEKMEEENEEESDDIEKLKSLNKDFLYLKVYDGECLIRILKRKILDSIGIYFWRWFMDEVGVDRLLRNIRDCKNEFGGI